MAEHRHVWSPWLPKDRRHKYRYCLLRCGQVETKEVKA